MTDAAAKYPGLRWKLRECPYCQATGCDECQGTGELLLPQIRIKLVTECWCTILPHAPEYQECVELLKQKDMAKLMRGWRMAQR